MCDKYETWVLEHPALNTNFRRLLIKTAEYVIIEMEANIQHFTEQALSAKSAKN